MSTSSTLTGSDLLRIETICDRFEQDCREGRTHPLERYAVGSGERKSDIGLLKELLKVEWDWRTDRGNPPELAEYEARNLLPSEILKQLFDEWSRNDPVLELGHFQLLEKLGSGSFGVVWRAWDSELNREVALKIAHLSLNEDASRFFRESRTASRLKHPNIVRILDAGKLDGRFYIARELVDGQSLASYLKQNRPSPRTAAEICLKIAKALEYSHAQGCIHRDIKPQNILLDENSEPHLTDFGLAKSLSTQSTETRSGTILGTPVYMSPEQARGVSRLADGRSDTYSLGVVLFQLLTGEPPFRGTFERVMLQVIQNDPPSPARLCPSLPDDLATICLKCMEKSPEQRYQSAGELVADLQLFLEERPIEATPIGRVRRLCRIAKRNPLTSMLIGMLVVSFLVIFAGSVFAAVRFHNAWQEEIRLRQRANLAMLNAEQSAELAHTEAEIAADVTSFLESVFAQSDFLGTHLTSASPDLFGAEVTAGQLLERAAERIQNELVKQPRVQSRLMDIIGNVYRSIGRMDEARQLFESAGVQRQKLKAQFPLMDLRIDEATHDYFMGEWYRTRGEYGPAFERLTRSLKKFRELLPPGDSRISAAVFQLGWLSLERKNADQARDYFQKALDIREQVLPPNHQAINACHVALVFCDFNDDNVDVVTLLRRGAQMFPDEETSQLFGDVALMILSRRFKWYGLAERKYRSIVRTLGESLGRSDPLYLLVLGDFADMLYRAGKYSEAFPTIMPAIEVGERLAPNHPKLKDAYRKLGRELVHAGQWEQGAKFLRQVVNDPALSRREKQESLFLLVEVLIQQQDYEPAEELLSNMGELVGLEMMSWHEWLRWKVALAQEDPGLAAVCRKKLLAYLPAIKMKYQAPSWVLRFGDMYRDLGDNELAQERYELAVAKLRKSLPRYHPRIGEALLRIASLLDSVENPGVEMRSKIVELLEEADKIFKLRLPSFDVRYQTAQRLLSKWR